MEDFIISFIYKKKESIDNQIKQLDPDDISDCESCQSLSRLFGKKELLNEIIDFFKKNS